MADRIIHKRSLTPGLVPSTSSVELGELTINVADGKAHIRRSGSAGDYIVPIVTAGTVTTGSIEATGGFTGSLFGTASYALSSTPTFIDNFITVGMPGSNTNYTTIESAVNSITDASATNTYTVKVYPGIYVENPITLKSYVAIKGESSISTVVSASNPSSSLFVMADQSMVIDMQIQGCTAPSVSAIYYSSPTTPQTNAIAYVENVRFGTNYTNAMVQGSGSSGNCILQCSNVKYGGYTDSSLSSFTTGFYVTSGSSGGIGRMQLRNVTSTNGGVAGSDPNQIFALADAPGCTFIVNGCLLTRATGAATGTGFKVYNGGSLRLTGVNFQRWINGIWAPQTGSAPSIDAVALNFENCTTDVLVQHTGTTGKVQGTDTFLKTNITSSAPLYEVGQDPRRITVGKKGADFTSISASVAYITDSGENNRYVIEVGPGQYVEKEIDLTGRPYVSIVGSSIQTTQIFPSSSNQHLIKMGINNEVSFLSLTNAPAGYSALYVDDIGDYAQAHKLSFFDCDTCLTVLSSTQDTKFYGEYLDFNGVYSTGSYVSSSNGFLALASLENYYQFPTGSSGLIANYGTGATTELDMYSGAMIGEGAADPTSVAVLLENGADLQASGFDFPGWGSAVKIHASNSASFNIVGTMIHDSVNYDFEILHPSSSCRYQGTADHSKISNVSPNFFWAFLDETDGEFDITRKISVTFDDGTHTDASTLIFYGSPMGVIEGGTITVSSGLTITTAAGYGYLHNSGSTVFQRIDWNNTNITLSPNTNNYIYIDETTTLLASPTLPSNTQNIILGRVVTNDTGVELIDNSRYAAEHMANALSTFNRNALGPVYADGSTVTEDAIPFKLDVTAGLFYFGENQYDPTGGSAITFTRYYQSGSGAFGWNKSSTDLVPANQYNSGSTLTALSASSYTKHTLYTVGEGPDEEYFLVVGQNQYATLVEAENAGLPTPPTYFTDGVVSLAAIYVQSGSANITQIQDIRPTIGFRSAGVNASSTHGNLLGLGADDHTQYLLVNGTRAMSGDLSLGSNDITNVATINATSVTASLLGTASYATSALTASYVFQTVSSSYATTSSYAVTASYALNGGGGSTFPYTGSAQITGSLGIIGSLANGLDILTIGSYSHAEGSLSQTGITTAYSASISAGLVTLDLSYGDVSADFTSGNLLYLNDSLFDGTYGAASFTISSSNFTTQTEVQLEDITVTTTKAFVGDLGLLLTGGSWNGNQTITANYSHAEGSGTQTIGNYSHTEGLNSKAFGVSSHAEGRNTQAIGQTSHAEGFVTEAVGFYAHAEGQSTQAKGQASHTEGLSTKAIGDYSHAEGEGTIASGSAQHAAGKYNTQGNATSLVIIGNGTDDNNRRDLALFNTDGIQFNQPVTASIISGSFRGQLQGTATSASFATTASYVLQAVSSSFASTASYVLQSVSSSFASTASFIQNAQTASNITPAISNDADTRILTANGDGTLNAESLLTFDGAKLSVLYQSGDEGGEILLNKPVTNTTLTGSGVTIDIYQNKIRFFEQGGAARGAYIDLTAAAGGAGTNLLSGGGSGATFNGGTNVNNRLITATGTSPELNGEANLTFDGSTLAVTGNVTASSFTGSFSGDGSGLTNLPSTSGTSLGTVISITQIMYPFSGF